MYIVDICIYFVTTYFCNLQPIKMASIPTKIGKGRIIHSQAREIIANVLQFMKEEAASNTLKIPLTNFKERLIAATKIGDNTYRRIAKEAKAVNNGQVSSFTSPSKKRNYKSPKSTIAEWQSQTIRRIIHNFYLTERRRPSLKGTFVYLL